MTARNKQAKAAPKRARKVEKEKPPEVITLPMMRDGTPEQMAKHLAKHMPDWDKLQPWQQDEMVALCIAESERNEPAKVKLGKSASGSVTIEPAGACMAFSYLRLQRDLGATSLDSVNSRSNELIRYLESVGGCNDGRYNAALAFMSSMAPRDEAEAMLLLRHYVTHDAAIRALSQVGNSAWVPQMQTFGNLAVKLLARADQQLETLAKLRRGGEQIVKHIHIDNRNGGQVAVAETIQTGGKRDDLGQPPYEQGALVPAMLGHDPQGNGVPVPGDQGQEAVPATWRAVDGRTG